VSEPSPLPPGLTAGPIEYDPWSNDFDFHDTDEVQNLTDDSANDYFTPAVFQPECLGVLTSLSIQGSV
jgi:hypothetical protein